MRGDSMHTEHQDRDRGLTVVVEGSGKDERGVRERGRERWR